MHRLLAIGLTCLVAAAASADVTYWQADPSQPDNWFLPWNWTAGVPCPDDRALIENGGTAIIGIRTRTDPSDSESWHGAAAWTLEIGGRRGGAVSQIWLHADFTRGLYISAPANVRATYKLSGGSLSAGRIQLGYEYEVGEFAQTGGTARTDRLTVGAWPCCWPDPSADLYLPPSRFTLVGGEFDAGTAAIGTAAIGRAVLEGGILTVRDLLTIGGPRPWPPIDRPVLMEPEPVDPPVGEADISIYLPP
ncbi:MAG: hypothetical protein U9R68_07190, partial [Planctomycetota bacterium]|nr:hypothetical protein [Planctomycetota bacterium]